MALPPVGKAPFGGEAGVMFNAITQRRSTVFYCEHQPNTEQLTCEIVASGFRAANGITANADMSEVYVADTLSNTIVVHSRNPSNNSLKPIETLEIGHSIDNLKFDIETKTI